MNKRQKVQFINELVTNIKKGIMEKVDSIPDNWNGIELRMLIAEHFKAAVFSQVSSRERVRRFWIEVSNKNLI